LRAFSRTFSVSAANPTITWPDFRREVPPEFDIGLQLQHHGAFALDLLFGGILRPIVPTAAAIITSCDSGSNRSAVSRISAAVSTGVTSAPAGGAIVTGPETSRTRAPRLKAISAKANPMRPLDRFVNTVQDRSSPA